MDLNITQKTINRGFPLTVYSSCLNWVRGTGGAEISKNIENSSSVRDSIVMMSASLFADSVVLKCAGLRMLKTRTVLLF